MNTRSVALTPSRLPGSFAAACAQRAPQPARHAGMFRAALLSLAAICLLAPFAAAQLTDATCGGEGDRICTPLDLEYVVANTRSNAGTLCDYGLLPLPNPSNPVEPVCTNFTRRRLGNILDSADTRGFLIREQEQAIGADVPLNLVNTLGTHNSYSNYDEGYNEDYRILDFNLAHLKFTTVDDPFAADQYYSISDQMDAGARFIRLDPYFYSGEMRMCHGPEYCNNTSDGRLFVYAIREIADWLAAHPGEFVILDLQDNNVTASQEYLEDAPIEKYLARYLFTEKQGQPDYLSEGGTPVWPTLRQLRAKGERAMIFSSLKTTPSYAWSSKTYWTNDTSAKTLVPNQNLNLGEGCKDDNGNDTRRRAILDWNNVGEDRSGSTTVVKGKDRFPFFTASNEFGLMDSAHTSMAAKCGASVIDLDFWGAMDHAFHFDVDVLGDEITLVDFRGPANDPRPLNASWSYIVNDSNIGPAVLDESQQAWVSEPQSLSFRYACAALQETPDVYNGLYDWEITSASGPWSDGEAACQQLGTQYHFWFPQSVYEQSNLLRYDLIHKASLSGAVWLNYRSATYGHQLVTAPQRITINTPAGATPASQTIWVSGGKGGTLRIISNGPYAASQVFVNGWPTNQVVLTPRPGMFNQAGTFRQEVAIEETDPNTGAIGYTTKVPVQIVVTEALAASATQIDLTPGSEQVIQVTDAQGSQDRIPFTITGAPSWLVVEQAENQTPAQVKTYAKNMAPGTYMGSFQLVPQGADAGDGSTSISVLYVVK